MALGVSRNIVHRTLHGSVRTRYHCNVIVLKWFLISWIGIGGSFLGGMILSFVANAGNTSLEWLDVVN
jgi:hypothetical protein